MSERHASAITRTVTVSDLTPTEVASIFAQWNDTEQARFFEALVEDGKSFEGTGWCGQALWFVPNMNRDAQNLLAVFASYLDDESKALI